MANSATRELLGYNPNIDEIITVKIPITKDFQES